MKNEKWQMTKKGQKKKGKKLIRKKKKSIYFILIVKSKFVKFCKFSSKFLESIITNFLSKKIDEESIQVNLSKIMSVERTVIGACKYFR